MLSYNFQLVKRETKHIIAGANGMNIAMSCMPVLARSGHLVAIMGNFIKYKAMTDLVTLM